MAILSNLRRSLVNVINPDKQVQNAVAKAFYSLIGQTYTAYDTNAKAYIEQGYLYNPTVFAVINQRANKAKTVPYYIKKITDESAKKRLDSFRMATKQIYKPHQIIKKAALETKAFEEKMFDFPMEKPNELQSWSDVIALYETFIATTGNFYMYILRGETMTEPQQVYVLPSHLMSIILKKNASTLGTESPISHYMLIEGNQYVEFEAENVVHIKTPNPEFGTNGEHLYGLSPLRAALRNIQSSNLGIDGNVKAMLNSGAFGFIHGKGQTAMTDSQAAGIKERLQEMDLSNERLGKIGGSTAELGFTRIALTTDELKPFDYLMFDEKQICNVLGWDNKLLNNDQGAKYDNVEWAEQRTTVNTMIPSLKMFQDAITEKFIPMFKGYDGTIMEFDYSELPEMQIDIGEMVVWLNSALDRGVINRNEFRKAIQYPISEDMDLEVYTVQTDVIPLSEALDENFGLMDPLAIQA